MFSVDTSRWWLISNARFHRGRPRRAFDALRRNWRGTYTAVGLLAASVLVLAGIMRQGVMQSHSGGAKEAKQFAQFVRTFAEDPETAQRLLVANYNGRAAGMEELLQSPRYTAIAASNPPAGYTLQQAYALELPCCACSQIVLRREAGGLVSIFEHGDAEKPSWMSGFRCTNMQCGETPCEIADTGGYLAASCRVRDRHFTIVGAAHSGEVEVLIAWLQEAGRAAAGGLDG